MLKTRFQENRSRATSADLERRALGIYYTPHSVSAALCDWAIRRPSDRVLEPSFGGCVFLVEAAAALRQLGAPRPFAQLYGCDVDRQAFVHLRRAFPKRNIEGRFVRGDFLALKPNQRFAPDIDAVVGNPPYVSNHNMTKLQRVSALESSSGGALEIRGTASLWAHFLNHSLRFLRDAGRLAMVLPGTAFRTDYGQRLLPQLSRQFGRVDVIQLRERVFAEQGIRDTPSILLCDGWNTTTKQSSAIIHTEGTMEACAQRILELRHPRNSLGLAAESRLESAMALFRQIGHYGLGDLAIIKIGVVTGANRFFALRSTECAGIGLPETATVPFFSHMSMTPALAVTGIDVRDAIRRNERCLLLDPPENIVDRSLREYLSTFPDAEIKRNRTFQKRTLWYKPMEGDVPDAFLSYMNARSARLVLNSAGLQSLNNIHRLYFRDHVTKLQEKLTALTLMSSIGQLAAELLGRVYGGGVLKLEPSDASRLPIPAYGRDQALMIERGWNDVNQFMRRGAYEKAILTADVLIATCSRTNNGSIATARDLLRALRNDRSGS